MYLVLALTFIHRLDLKKLVRIYEHSVSVDPVYDVLEVTELMIGVFRPDGDSVCPVGLWRDLE